MSGRFCRIAALVATILTAGGASAEGTDVLYWMVDDNATINRWWGSDAGEYSISDYFSEFYPADSEFAARVRVTGGDISGDMFLNLYIGDGASVDGTLGVDFEDIGGGYWGAGVPEGNQSPSQDYSAGSPEYKFIVEIGNIVDDEWTTIAMSDARSYSSLKNDYIHPTYDLTPASWQIWTPTSFTAVPEPSCGLLTVLGLALLALRRKKLDKGA